MVVLVFQKIFNSLISWCKENKIDTEVIEATQKANSRLLKKSGSRPKKLFRKKIMKVKNISVKKIYKVSIIHGQFTIKNFRI